MQYFKTIYFLDLLIPFQNHLTPTYAITKHAKLRIQFGKIEVIVIERPASVFAIKLTPKIFETIGIFTLNHEFKVK